MTVDGTDPRPADPEVAARIRIVGGGEPTAEQLAALVLALTPTVAPEPVPAEQQARPSAWRRAAMIEGVGGRPPASPADLDVAALRD